MSAWSFIIAFGWISLLGDFVYEGARSITGPLLASLGASAVAVGVITGAGEAAALVLRLGSGPLADRTRRFWALAITGYVLTVIAVPLLGYSAVLWVAAVLVIGERVGKAVRSPAKDTMLSHAAAAVGRGKGFAVQEAMDQVGAVLGPLTVAGMLVITGGDYGPSLVVLALPGAAMLAILFWLRSRVPVPAAFEAAEHVPEGEGPAAGEPAHAGPTSEDPGHAAVPRPEQGTRPLRLPPIFWHYAGFAALTMTGFATFGVLSFHMVARGIFPAALVPVIYAAAMAADALAALATGWLYDRFGPRVLLVLPVVAGLIPVFAFTGSVLPVILGSILWGFAMGIQESTIRATVADLVAPARRGTAYGIFAAVVGAATLLGGYVAGALYEYSIPVLILVTIAIQVAALITLGTLRLTHRTPARP